jgi:hypothetical protein
LRQLTCAHHIGLAPYQAAQQRGDQRRHQGLFHPRICGGHGAAGKFGEQ